MAICSLDLRSHASPPGWAATYIFVKKLKSNGNSRLAIVYG